MKKAAKDISLKLILNTQKSYITFTMIYHLPESMRIEKDEKLEFNLHEKTEYFINIEKFKASFEPWTSLKKVHRVIRFNQIS